jgi:diaminopimelate decarboxylase
MSAVKPQHAPQHSFPVVDDCLQVGAMPLTQLAHRVGKTPFYAYDRSLISERVRSIRKSMPDDLQLHYSVKANPMPALLHHMVSLVDGLDVASGGELRVALDTTMRAAKISFAGPGKSNVEISQAIAAGVILNLESANEFERVIQIGEVLGLTPKVVVRVNPEFELKSSGMKMGGGAKQFGIDAEQVPDLLKRIGLTGVEFHGLHIFSGSQNLNSAAIIEAQLSTIELALRLAEHAPRAFSLLNIGGGFGIPYFPGEVPLDLRPIGENLSLQIDKLKATLPEVKVAIELGRYIVGEAGIYVTRILDRKVSRGETFLVCDGGMNHHLAASGNLGQVIRKNYPVIIGNRVNSTEREFVSIVGPLCTPLDLIAHNMEMSRAQVGDLVVVFQSGAYGLTASPSAFLSQPQASEIFV